MKALGIAVSAIALFAALPAAAADLVIEEPAVYVDTVDAGWYVQFLGGYVPHGTITYSYDFTDGTDVFDLTHGYAVAGVVGYQMTENISLELDAFFASRNISEDPAYFVASASLMAGLRYTLDVTDNVAVYAGVALGGIWARDEWWDGTPGGDLAAGFGYQIKLGAEVEVAENIALVGELRYQAPIGNLTFVDYPEYHASFGTTSILAGIKLGF